MPVRVGLLLDDDGRVLLVREDARDGLAGRERDRGRGRLVGADADFRSHPAGTFSETEYVPGASGPESSCCPSESEKPLAS